MDQEYSKEYRLEKNKVDLESISSLLSKIKKNIPDIYFETYEKIPDNLLEIYSRFAMEAETNTPGILQINQNPKMTVEYITKQYNLRTEDKFYFDILAFDKDHNIVGKLNSWGLKIGGFHSIFHLYVLEEYRGRGIGTYLLCQTVKYAYENNVNISKFELQTHESNTAAQKIRKLLNFEEAPSFLSKRTQEGNI